ncbi:MAG TPA: hypothetical protein VFK37_09025, partial [Bacillales bacterium]|nr:hypothetical protein [Bacillales bacterium]
TPWWVNVMLPDILPVAERHQLVFQPQTYCKKETRAKCPFCGEDLKPGKKKKYYLSLNTESQVFKCWFCGVSGGVYRFISLLEGTPEFTVKEKYCKSSYQVHPAERLTKQQLHLIDYYRRPDWYRIRQRDPQYYRRTRNLIWQEWKAFVANQQRFAFQLLVIGIRKGNYQKAIQGIQEREKAIQWPLLKKALRLYSCAERPAWTEQAKAIALHVCDPETFPFSSTEREEKVKTKGD